MTKDGYQPYFKQIAVDNSEELLTVQLIEEKAGSTQQEVKDQDKKAIPSSEEAARELLQRVLDKIGGKQGYVLANKQGDIYIDLGSKKTRVGEKFRVFRVIKKVKHPKTGEIRAVKAPIGIIQVKEIIDSKNAICKVKGKAEKLMQSGDQIVSLTTANKQKESIVIGRFNQTQLAKDLQNIMISEASEYKNINFINRENIDRLIKEKELSYTGLIEEDSRQLLGNLLGATHILIGDISRGDQIQLSAKLLEVETGKIVSSAVVQLAKSAVAGNDFQKVESSGTEKDIAETDQGDNKATEPLSNSEFLGSQVYGRSGRDKFSSIKKTNDGGYIAVGHTTGLESDDGYVIKLNKQGEKEWVKSYGGNKNDYFYDIVETSDQGYLLVGETFSFYDGYEESQTYRVKIDSSGSKEWQDVVGGKAIDDSFQIAKQSKEGDYFLIGYNGGGSYDPNINALVVKLNPHGKRAWWQTFDYEWSTHGVIGEYHEYIYGGVQAFDGDYILVGSSRERGYILNIDSEYAEGNRKWEKIISKCKKFISITKSNNGYMLLGEKGYLLKLGFSGKQEYIAWEKKLNSNYPVFLTDIEAVSGDGYIIAGYVLPTKIGKQTKGKAGYIAKIDSEGNKKWERVYDSAGDDYLYSIQETDSGSYIAVGERQNDGWVLKVDSQGRLPKKKQVTKESKSEAKKQKQVVETSQLSNKRDWQIQVGVSFAGLGVEGRANNYKWNPRGLSAVDYTDNQNLAAGSNYSVGLDMGLRQDKFHVGTSVNVLALNKIVSGMSYEVSTGWDLFSLSDVTVYADGGLLAGEISQDPEDGITTGSAHTTGEATCFNYSLLGKVGLKYDPKEEPSAKTFFLEVSWSDLSWSDWTVNFFDEEKKVPAEYAPYPEVKINSPLISVGYEKEF